MWYLFKFYDSFSILEVVNLIENNEKLKKHLFRNMHTAIIWIELQLWVNTALITGQRFQWSFDIICTKHAAKSTQIILLYIILCRKVDFIKSTDWQYVIRSSVMKTRNWTFHETRFVPFQQILWQIWIGFSYWCVSQKIFFLITTADFIRDNLICFKSATKLKWIVPYFVVNYIIHLMQISNVRY